jgi:hypothetical protein
MTTLNLSTRPIPNSDPPAFAFIPSKWADQLKPISDAKWKHETGQHQLKHLTYGYELTAGTALVFPHLCKQGVFYAAHLRKVCELMDTNGPAYATVTDEGLTITTDPRYATPQRVTLIPRALRTSDTPITASLDWTP